MMTVDYLMVDFADNHLKADWKQQELNCNLIEGTHCWKSDLSLEYNFVLQHYLVDYCSY